MSGDRPSPGRAAWARAETALAVLALDPAGLGGLWLRARPGPARDSFMSLLDQCLPGPRKLPPTVQEEQLFGGVDLTGVLAGGEAVRTAGILSRPRTLILTMAERCPPRLAAHLGAAIDRGGHAVIACDEGAEPGEVPPPGLTERLGLFVALDGIARADLAEAPLPDLDAARTRLPGVRIDPAEAAALTEAAAALGIGSLRAPIQAIRAARALAALAGRDAVADADVRGAAELVFAHRGALPDEADTAPEPPPDMPEPADGTEPSEAGQPDEIPAELLVEAAMAALPPDLLRALAAGRATRTRSGADGSGAARRGNRRGRPLPARPGHPGSDRRIDLIATLRAAAPWQRMRGRDPATGGPVRIRASDIRIRRFQEKSDRLLIFTVDASGSLAMTRLAEAKGAVELLLGEAYSRRDHVALIAFRGAGAELLLPPTRSLVQTKRRLQALPGGGGTPLAAGLSMALDVARQARAKGLTPTLALLTDGGANIGLDGQPGRQAAAEDAERVAKAARAEGLPGLVVDTAPRPQTALQTLSGTLDATYIALPRADARRLSAAVSATFDG